MGNPEPNPILRKPTPGGQKAIKKKDRCRDSMEAVLTNGVDRVVGKGINPSIKTRERMKEKPIYICREYSLK